MTTIDMRDLEKQLAEVMQQVKNGETVRVLEGGSTIAMITPATPINLNPEQRPYTMEEGEAFLAKLDQMAEEIGKHWPAGVTAVDAVRDARRDL